MGFMDKVKAAAQDAATQAKSATGQAQTKIEQVQLKNRLNSLAEELGQVIFKERTKGTPAADAERLITEMKDLEARIDALATAAPTGEAGNGETSADSTPPAPEAPAGGSSS
jgi:hypothetical protein